MSSIAAESMMDEKLDLQIGEVQLYSCQIEKLMFGGGWGGGGERRVF
jgi:hypothetical protein